ncbi:MAG: primosomal protein N' [Candidatus Gracilibacteria bacterium]|jgi:primosomal protein N' (replication factor Y)
MADLYAEILIPQNIGKGTGTLTYKIPENLAKEVKIGSEVLIPLRSKKIKGTILKLNNKAPEFQTKEILGIVSEKTYLQEWQIELVQWISDYYACPMYKCLEMFIPKRVLTKDRTGTEAIDLVAEIEPLSPPSKIHELTPDQKEIFDKILDKNNKISLIHGITGSGKTEIYLQLAQHYTNQDKQALILVPEISITPQMTTYFEKIFSKKIAVIHSKLTSVQRKNAWKKILNNEAKVVIGSRSSLFSPFQNLGLIITDEEHEFSYKQDQSPRYSARDVIYKMSELLPNLKIVFGSATPSVETYFKAQNKEIALFEMNKKIYEQPHPKVEIVDMRDEMKKKNYSIFSETLAENISQVLERNEQAILFLNKRGTSSAVICRECGYIEKCGYCDVAMTYHQADSKLTCHHCGFKKNPPTLCPSCKGIAIRFIGSGTEKVEEELHKIFPKARIIRADKDTTQKRESFKKIYNDFKNHKADILIGTQLISHGLHLPNVSLVGIMLADISLLFPDFRTSERTFQLLTQIAGRAGRIKRNHDIEDKVVIQTYMPENPVLKSVQDYDYKEMYDFAINERRIANYPPFSKLIKLTFSHANEQECIKAIQRAKALIQENSRKNSKNNSPSKKLEILTYPSFIKKIKGKFIFNMLIKGASLTSEIVAPFQNIEDWKIDIDPISTL